MRTSARKILPVHVAGLLRFLSQPNEKSNEDLALSYFRSLYPDSFQRQAGATGADGYVAGHFVLELKGRTGDWFSGLCQGLAYKRDLDFSMIVVAAKDFLAVWRVDDLPDRMRAEILGAEGAPSGIGRRYASAFQAEKASVLRKAIWQGNQISLALFASEPELILRELRAFEETLSAARKVRRSITPRNFANVLKTMVEYFDPKQPIKAVNAFYSMVYAWDEHAVLQISQRTSDQATLGGELIRDLVPGKRVLFKEFVESHMVRLGPLENTDDFFARYDVALDSVDRDYRIRHGIFFTDLDLSKFALWLTKQYVADLGRNYIVMDPACGSGNLVTNWRSPLELRHKVVSELAPDLLYVVERRMKGDRWHDGKFTVVPKTTEGRGLNFLENSASAYLSELTRYLTEKGHHPDKPLAFLCNPPYRSDDDQTSAPAEYPIHQSLIDVVGRDASSERYCCFLAQMKLICREAKESGLPGGSVLLVFTKAAWLTERPMFRQLRRSILKEFRDCAGFLVNGKQFFDVKGKFPVAFTIWKYVGPGAELDEDRPIPVVDLTLLTKRELAALPWDQPDLLQRQCEQILQNGPRVALGAARQPLKEWVGQRMTDFKRSRRKAEEGGVAGGLPRGDIRLHNKKVYGEALGGTIGFMDNLTPCRNAKVAASVPHFHLDPRLMRVRDSRCLSGHSDHYSYQARNLVEAQKLFFWYALGRTLAEHGYPMWADASEIWAPSPNYEPDSVVLAYALAIGFAENECVEVVFPANNPVVGAVEITCSNPMAPNIATSFWSQHLDSVMKRGQVATASRLVQAVKEVYRLWGTRFRGQPDIHVPYSRSYFVTDGLLRPTAGIVQIRDYAAEMEDKELLAALETVRERLRAAKREFYSMLINEQQLDYFGPSVDATALARHPRTQSTFDRVLEKRLALASVIVGELEKDRHFGRTKLAKIFYLADVSHSLDLQTEYYREAAGPLDARTLYNDKIGIEALGARHRYFTTKESGRSIRYVPGPALSNIVQHGPDLFGSKWEKVKSLIHLCRPLTTDQCEIIATLFACWNDLLLSGARTDDESITYEFLARWHEKKRRFSADRLRKALLWMRTEGVIPKGRGKRTLVKPRV
jgi:hypothetical protein